jgi:signal transduction histidine kinase
MTRPETETLPVRILLVEDEPADAELIIDDLREDGIACTELRVDTESDYLQALDSFRPDIVLSDLSLPAFDGYEALRLLRRRDKVLPFVFISGTIGEEVAVNALRNGATDYILKQNPARLASAVRRALHEAIEQDARRHAEKELLRAQRFESLALLAGGLSHDLRNLLQPLLMAADALDEYREDERLVRLADTIRDCGQRGLDMVSSMLTFARGAKRNETVDVDDLFQALGLLLAGTVPRAITLNIRATGGELEFEGNHTELQQCLLNLCLNAIQAMPEGGTLTVSGHCDTLNAADFRENEQAAPGDFVCLSVADTGTGMSADILGRLFEPFFTTKASGTGLGLMSCQRIAEAHEGFLRVDSTPGEGSSFSVFLPVRSCVPDAVLAAENETPHGHGQSILVVEEEAAQLSLLVSILDGSGYAVNANQSGSAALQSLDAEGLPELVVMDAEMNLLTGVRTLAALLERDYHGGVLLLTRPDNPPDLDGLPPIENLSMLDKPVDTYTLLHAVHQALDAAAAN